MNYDVENGIINLGVVNLRQVVQDRGGFRRVNTGGAYPS